MIPFADLKAQYLSIKDEIDAAIAGTLESSQFILGKEVAAFEEEFAAFQKAAHAIGTNSGTSALHLALLAAGVGAGDEVITTPFTFVATAAAILYAGARPVYVDIDPETYNLDPARIAAAITPRTKAIVPVHLFGHPADMDPILEIARRRGLVVIEDACQAHAAEYKGRRVGGIGDIGCFSFYPGKNLGAYGEAGCVTTNNPELARTVRLLRNWGEESRYHHILRGYNYRMEGLQGAILRVKLRHLESLDRSAPEPGAGVRSGARRGGRAIAARDALGPARVPRTRDRERVSLGYPARAFRAGDSDGDSLSPADPFNGAVSRSRVSPRKSAAGRTGGEWDSFTSDLSGTARSVGGRSCRGGASVAGGTSVIPGVVGSLSPSKFTKCGSGPARRPTTVEDPDLLGQYPRTMGLPSTQDSQRPMLVMGRPSVVTFVQRGFEDSTTHRWAGSLMEDADLSRLNNTGRGQRSWVSETGKPLMRRGK